MLTKREERIVAWLRWMSQELDDIGDVAWSDSDVYRRAADAIERGEHLTWKPEPTIPASEWMGKPSVAH